MPDSSDQYTAITFAPVQGFIEKSRKLRDLYGSSIILSYLADQVCDQARKTLATPDAKWPADPVISPAHINVTQGTPNQILIRGHFPEDQAKAAFDNAWKELCQSCCQWIEQKIPDDDQPWKYNWARSWQQWSNHAWEFFYATGSTPSMAKQNLMAQKVARAWTGVNWVGESSTLSGIDSRAWPMLDRYSPHNRSKSAEETEIKAFYQKLSEAIGKNQTGEAIITPREQLSIPELVKRLVTIEDINSQNSELELPLSFKKLNRWKEQSTLDEAQRASKDDKTERWTGWFQGDGDRAGNYLKGKPPDEMHEFSRCLREWGKDLHKHLPPKTRTGRRTLDPDGRIIYAGGDDFLGILYRNDPDPPLSPWECVDWFSTFKSSIWNRHQQPITVSVGFVWAAPKVPQRDVLQHCREAQASAKDSGRDRIAFRILFNGGNHLEWVCPWWLLEEGLLEAYRDRNDVQGSENNPNWTHIYNDVAVLESRHAFSGHQNEVALSLFEVYFGKAMRHLVEIHLWREGDRTGILGDSPEANSDPVEDLNQWIINLAKVGFHLHSKQK